MFQNLRRMMPENQRLTLTCEGCGHGAVWTRAEAFARLDPDASPPDLRRRLRCGLCRRFAPRLTI